ncbi:MAG: hypothetical protein PHU85_15550 [Phycisphaerae bacterium]|nr:hypothetical protein [Phycisphaerae bacterium]
MSPEQLADMRVSELMRRIVPEVRFNAISFENSLLFLRDLQRVTINPNWWAMEAVGITRQTEITLHVRDASFETTLMELLSKAAGKEGVLDFALKDGMIRISTIEDLSTLKYILVHNVRDLLDSTVDFLELVRTSILPDTWAPCGDATILETDGLLIVRQSARGHREIDRLVSQLRQHPRTNVSLTEKPPSVGAHLPTPETQAITDGPSSNELSFYHRNRDKIWVGIILTLVSAAVGLLLKLLGR